MIHFAIDTDQNNLRATIAEGHFLSTTRRIGFQFAREEVSQLVNRNREIRRERTFQEYYTESRDFRDPKIVIRIFPEDGSEPDLIEFSYNQDRTEPLIVETKKPVAHLSLDIIGTREMWKCFSPESCVPSPEFKHRIYTYFEGRSDFAGRTSTLLQCGREASVTYKLSDPQNLSISIPYSQSLALNIPAGLTGRSERASTCEDFSGFEGKLTWTNSLSSYGQDPIEFGQFLVSRDGDQIFAQITFKAHKSCEFIRSDREGRGYPHSIKIGIEDNCSDYKETDLTLVSESIVHDGEQRDWTSESCSCIPH